MLCPRVELVVVCLVLLSQSIESAPSNPSQVSKSSQHENLHENEEREDGMFASSGDSEETTRNSAGSLEEHEENVKGRPVAGGLVVSRTGPGALLLSSDSSSTSTRGETTEPFTISSRKSLSGTTPTESKSHSQDNISEKRISIDSRNKDWSSAAEDSPNKSDTRTTIASSHHSFNRNPTEEEKIAAGDAISSGQRSEEEHTSSTSSEAILENNSNPTHLHGISLNRSESELLPSQFLLPPPPVGFIAPSQSQEYHSGENERVSHSGTIFSSDAESNEKEDVDPSTRLSNSTICSQFSTSRACTSNSSSSEENPNKHEEVDVVLIPGDSFRPPTIFIIDTIITEPNSSGEEDNGNYSEENGSSPMIESVTTTEPTTGESESSENVSAGIVEKLNSPHDALNGTIPHDSRLNDKKGSLERNEMSGLHLRPWFINHEPKHSRNGSADISQTSTTPQASDSISTPISSIVSGEEQNKDREANSSSGDEKISPILPAGHFSTDGPLSSSQSSDDDTDIDIDPAKKISDSSSDSTAQDESTKDISSGNGEKERKPQTSSPIVSGSEGVLNRRRRDSIFSHLPNNSSRSQSVTHSPESKSTISSQETNNGGNSTSASIESEEMDSNGNATTGKDTIHIFLEILHLEPISSDESGESGATENSSSPNPHKTRHSPTNSASKDSQADNSASDGSLDSTSNQNSTSSTSHRVSRRESHSAAPTVSAASSHGPGSGPSSSGAVGGTAGKSNPSPSPASATSSTTHSPPKPNTASQAKQSPPPAAGKPTSTAAPAKPITSNKASFELPPLLNVQQH